MAIKTIPIDSVVVGMYLAGIDRPWMETPFLRHKFLIKTQSQIAKLKQCGIKTIDIDPSRGLDVATASDVPEPATSGASHTDVTNVSEDISESELTPEARLENIPATLQGKSLSDELSSVRDVRNDMLNSVSDLLSSVSTTGVVPAKQVKELTHTIISQTLEHEDACVALIRTREFSPDLHDHSLSVGTLAVLLGRLIGYEEAQLQTLATAALLHDVGLLRLPRTLLFPNGRKTEAEQEQYNSHIQLSVDILKESPNISEEVRNIVVAHHAPWDENLSEADSQPHSVAYRSQLLRIVDEYDELLTGQQRPEPMSGKDALRELYKQAQNKKLNQQLVSQFISQIGIYPIYSLVELNTGERGIVTANSKDNLLHPIILLIQDAERKLFAEPVPINFSTLPSDTPSPEITKILDPDQEGIQVESVLADWITV